MSDLSGNIEDRFTCHKAQSAPCSVLHIFRRINVSARPLSSNVRILSLKTPKKQPTKLCLQNRKKISLNCTMLKVQRLEDKHYRSRSYSRFIWIYIVCNSAIVVLGTSRVNSKFLVHCSYAFHSSDKLDSQNICSNHFCILIVRNPLDHLKKVKTLKNKTSLVQIMIYIYCLRNKKSIHCSLKSLQVFLNTLSNNLP